MLKTKWQRGVLVAVWRVHFLLLTEELQEQRPLQSNSTGLDARSVGEVTQRPCVARLHQSSNLRLESLKDINRTRNLLGWLRFGARRTTNDARL